MTDRPEPRTALIAAVARNGTIGRDGGMPWHLPADLKQFQTATQNHPVIVGRTTRDSLPGKRLPGRRLIVVTSAPEKISAPDVTGAVDLAQALDLARADARAHGLSRIWIAGGASIYSQALPLADEIRLSRIHADIPGDTIFPPLDPEQWALTRADHHPGDDDRPAWSLEILQRR